MTWTVGRAGRSGGVYVPPVTPPVDFDAGAVSVANTTELNDLLEGALTGRSLVMWNHGTQDLFDVFNTLGTNDILVLPERAEPYTVSQMYRTSNGQANGSNPLTDRAGCRSKGGILGFGPGARIAPSGNFPTYAAQTVSEGVREALVENWTAGSIHANFTLEGKPGGVGGLAYALLKIEQAPGGALVERVSTSNHYGFQNFEPGETFGITVQGRTGLTTIRRCDVDGRNMLTGVKEGSGGMHFSRGAQILTEFNRIRGVRGHALAHWCRAGATTHRDTVLEDIGTSLTNLHGNGINVEVCGTHDFTLERVTWDMRNHLSGNPGAQVAVVSVNAGEGQTSWPKGRTQVAVIDPTILGPDTRFRTWTNPTQASSATYHGAVNRAVPADIITPAGIVRRDTGFGVSN